MSTLLKNDHTGDKLITKPANDAFREGWERIFGEREEEEFPTFSDDFMQKNQSC